MNEHKFIIDAVSLAETPKQSAHQLNMSNQRKSSTTPIDIHFSQNGWIFLNSVCACVLDTCKNNRSNVNKKWIQNDRKKNPFHFTFIRFKCACCSVINDRTSMCLFFLPMNSITFKLNTGYSGTQNLIINLVLTCFIWKILPFKWRTKNSRWSTYSILTDDKLTNKHCAI